MASNLEAAGVPSHGFDYTPVDGKITDPNTGKKVVVSTITARIDGVVAVKYADSTATVILPVFAGVRRSGMFEKILATGTTAGIISGKVILEY